MFVLLVLPLLPMFMLISWMGSWLLSLSGIEVYIGLSLAFLTAIVGAALLFWAKLPLYRAGIYFSFGPSAVPDDRKSFYYWGMGLVIVALMLIPLRT
jgi:hypothetical protein